MRDLCFLTATELRALVERREVSVAEIVLAHLAQIAARGEPGGLRRGLPIAHKDLVLTRGLRTTFGSPIFGDFVPDHDALIVERLKRAGAITVGKTNTPEFGAGSQTFNDVFGATRNPYDPSKTCGGSSGGAAVALACGMLPVADGSDMGGSLRNPAAYCNVVGLRPSPGRVPAWPVEAAWSTLGVLGPMARTVQDTALLLAAMAGPDPRSPIAIPEPGERFLAPLGRDFAGVRVAWSRDLGGLPIDPRVTAVLEARRATLAALGCIVEEAEPDLADAREVFQAWRAWLFELKLGPLLERHRQQLKDTLIWNIEQGRRLTGPELGVIETKHTRLYHRMREFMTRYEFLLAPVTQVPPFAVTEPYVKEINGVPLPTYLDWMRACSDITVTGLPAISVPAGFTGDGLPVGLQIVGRLRDDFGLLQFAHAFEEATGFWKRRPALAG